MATTELLEETEAKKTSITLPYKKLYIDGDLVDAGSGERRPIIWPHNGQPVAEVAWANGADALRALKSTEEGFHVWSRTPLQERIQWMEKLAAEVTKEAEALGECVMLEMGKPWNAGVGDANSLVKCLRYFAELAKHQREEIIPDLEGTHHHLITRQPVGPVVALLAWNFPLLNIGCKVAPSLASGCSIIIRPSSSSPLSALAFGEICHRLKFPRGVINVLCGDTVEVGETLVKSRIPRMVTMIGSSEAGKKIVGLSNTSIKKFSLELGGNAPAIIFADADIKKAAEQLVALKFGNAGQVCVAPNRVFVHKQVYDAFVAEAKALAAKLTLGSGRGVKADSGPLIHATARDRVDVLVKKALQAGAKIVCGGSPPADASLSKGFYYLPTILTEVKNDMDVACQEIFGPVMPIIRFESEEEVIRWANDTEYGLAAYIFTNDLKKATRIPELLDFGTVTVNGPIFRPYLPHGGTKESGIGKDCSYLGLEEFYYIRRVSIPKK